jgi:hypothetical protein
VTSSIIKLIELNPIIIKNITLTKVKPSDGAASDFFGYSVSVGNGRIVIGAYLDDDNGSDSGSVYIFDLNGKQLAKIKASDDAASDQFGYSVSVGSGRIIVGASGDDDNGSSSGSAYIFDLNGNELTKIKASDGSGFSSFGDSVAIGNNRIVVGAFGSSGNSSGSGSAYIFDLNGNELSKIAATDGATSDFFGRSVAIGSGRIVIAAVGDDDNGSLSGSAYIYKIPETMDMHFEKILDTFKYG